MPPHGCRRLRHFLFCGETLLPETAARLLDRFPAAEVWNTYGPTEATVATTSIRVTRKSSRAAGRCPSAFPRPGTDDVSARRSGDSPAGRANAARSSSPGRTSAPVTSGEPDLTARAFFDEPDGHAPTAPATGDAGATGCFFSRAVRTVRSSSTATASNWPTSRRIFSRCRTCATAPWCRSCGRGRCSSWRPSSSRRMPAADAATEDRRRRRTAGGAWRSGLPAYMLPRKIYLRASLPLTANGKADRRHGRARRERQPPSNRDPLRQLSLFRVGGFVRSAAGADSRGQSPAGPAWLKQALHPGGHGGHAGACNITGRSTRKRRRPSDRSGRSAVYALRPISARPRAAVVPRGIEGEVAGLPGGCPRICCRCSRPNCCLKTPHRQRARRCHRRGRLGGISRSYPTRPCARWTCSSASTTG